MSVFDQFSSHRLQLDSSAGNAIVDEAQQEFLSARDVKYVHNHGPAAAQFDNNTAHTDCSGFVSKILFDQCPRQYNEILQTADPWNDHPLAKDFANFLFDLRHNPQQGFAQIKIASSLKNGDLIAWANPDYDGTGNTGHVMIVDGSPTPAHNEIIDGKNYNVIEVPVIDASSVEHLNDKLPPKTHQQHRDGIGEGDIRLIVDGNDVPIGYMEGTYSHESNKPIKDPTIAADIAMGRVKSYIANLIEIIAPNISAMPVQNLIQHLDSASVPFLFGSEIPSRELIPSLWLHPIQVRHCSHCCSLQ